MRLPLHLSWISISIFVSVFCVLGQVPEGYLILTTNEIKNGSAQFNAFVTHKQSKGFNVIVATEDQYGSGYTGNNAAKNIREWLQNNTADVVYLLIIANPDPTSNSPIPMAICCPANNLNSSYVPTDFYYAELTSNWNPDGDIYWGENEDDYYRNRAFDCFPELSVGRLPYRGSMTELDRILQKIMNYEDATDINWRSLCMLPMNPMDWETNSYPLGEAIKNDILIPKQTWDFYRLYDNTNPWTGLQLVEVDLLNPAVEAIPCNRPNVLSAWQNGSKNKMPGLVIWQAHGSIWQADDVFRYTDWDLLKEEKPAIVFQGSCDNGFPTAAEPCLAYSLLLKGAVATIASTNLCFYYPGFTDFSKPLDYQAMAYEFAKFMVTEGQEVGKALNMVKSRLVEDGAQWANFLLFNIYGCPDATLGFSKPTTDPTNLRAKTIATNQVRLTWFDNSNDETNFCYEYQYSSPRWNAG